MGDWRWCDRKNVLVVNLWRMNNVFRDHLVVRGSQRCLDILLLMRHRPQSLRRQDFVRGNEGQRRPSLVCFHLVL